MTLSKITCEPVTASLVWPPTSHSCKAYQSRNLHLLGSPSNEVPITGLAEADLSEGEAELEDVVVMTLLSWPGSHVLGKSFGYFAIWRNINTLLCSLDCCGI